MSNYLMKPRVKPANSKSHIQNKYWRNVFQRARANYHRGETPFSNTAHHKAHTLTDTAVAIANDLNVPAGVIYSQEFKVWHDKFITHVADNNPFAAYHSFRRLEQVAKKEAKAGGFI